MAAGTDAGSRDKRNTQRVRLTIDIDPVLHTRLNVAAAQEHVTMREYVEGLLRQALPDIPELTHAPQSGE